jgi:hypothetical protein
LSNPKKLRKLYPFDPSLVRIDRDSLESIIGWEWSILDKQKCFLMLPKHSRIQKQLYQTIGWFLLSLKIPRFQSIRHLWSKTIKTSSNNLVVVSKQPNQHKQYEIMIEHVRKHTHHTEPRWKTMQQRKTCQKTNDGPHLMRLENS